MAWFRNKPKSQDLKQLHQNLSNSFSHVHQDTANLSAWIAYMHNKIDYVHRRVEHVNQTVSELHQLAKHAIPSKAEIHRHVDSHPKWELMQVKMQAAEQHIQAFAEVAKSANEVAIRAHGHVAGLPEIYAKILIQFSEINERINRLQDKISSRSEEFGPHIDRLTAQIGRLKMDIEPLKTQVFETHEKELAALKEKVEPKKLALHERLLSRFKKNSKTYAQSVILSYLEKYKDISAQQLKDILVDEQGMLSKSSFYRQLEELEQKEIVGSVWQGKSKYLRYIPKRV